MCMDSGRFSILFVAGLLLLAFVSPAKGQLPQLSAPDGGTIIQCRDSLPEPPAGFCSFQAGSNLLLIQADVLTSDNVLVNGDLLIGADGRIACAACDCSAEPGADTATLLVCPGTSLSPGLINAYNDLNFSDGLPVDHGTERFEHRHDWRLGQGGHSVLNITPDSGSVVWGELRAVVNGVTSVAGIGGVDNLVRNLTDVQKLDGITTPAWHQDVFPLGDSSGQSMTNNCNYPELPDINPGTPYLPTVAEGIDARAQNEFTCLSENSGQGVDAIPGAAVRHGISLRGASAAEMRIKSTSLIWSPRSDISLYGLTAPVSLMRNSSVNLLLGSRWSPTGSLNLMRELQCARDFNTTYLNNAFSDRQLFGMVTENPALAAGMEADIGSLQLGLLADITLFDSGGNQGYAVVTEADESDVLLVLKAGTPVYGDAMLMEDLGAADPDCETLTVCGQSRRICAQRETGAPFPVGFSTPIAACGVPITGERTCLPERTVGLAPLFDGLPVGGDMDGDGVPDASDNCPDHFNPPLPFGNMQQADLDLDGIGDICDDQPEVNEDIMYADGFESDVGVGGVVQGLVSPGLVLQVNGVEELPIADNGPFAFNTLLPVSTNYFVGVDTAPNDQVCIPLNNTGITGSGDITDVLIECTGGPTTIYAVKRGEATGMVAIPNVLVTACAEGTGYFLQTVSGDPGFEGVDDSAVFAFDSSTQCGISISQGDRIDVLEGTVSFFFGQTQLQDVSFQLLSSGNPLPAPEVVNPSDVSGPMPTSLEGVLVQVQNVTVTMQDNGFGEFEVDNTLLIGDLMHQLNPLPMSGVMFTSITGVLRFNFNNQKLEPRDGSDIVQ